MTPIIKHIFFPTLLFTTTLLYGQSDSVPIVESFQRKNFVQPYVGTFNRQLLFNSTEENSMYDLLFSPNSSAFAGISVAYKNINLYLEGSLPNTQLVNRQNTNVRAISLFMHQFKQKFGFTAFTSYNKGLLMYMPNTASYGDRSDLRMITIGAHLYNILNGDRFSYAAANSLTELQTKSSGSFVLMVSPLFRQLYSAESIVPDSFRRFHLDGATTPSNSLTFLTLQARPGYVYNFVFNQGKYFISPAVYVGGGLEGHTYKSGNERHTGINFTAGYRIKTVAGINAEKYFLSLEYLRDSYTSYLYKTNIRNTYTEMSCNLGVRF